MAYSRNLAVVFLAMPICGLLGCTLLFSDNKAGSADDGSADAASVVDASTVADATSTDAGVVHPTPKLGWVTDTNSLYAYSLLESVPSTLVGNYIGSLKINETTISNENSGGDIGFVDIDLESGVLTNPRNLGTDGELHALSTSLSADGSTYTMTGGYRRTENFCPAPTVCEDTAQGGRLNAFFTRYSASTVFNGTQTPTVLTVFGATGSVFAGEDLLTTKAYESLAISSEKSLVVGSFIRDSDVRAIIPMAVGSEDLVNPTPMPTADDNQLFLVRLDSAGTVERDWVPVVPTEVDLGSASTGWAVRSARAGTDDIYVVGTYRGSLNLPLCSEIEPLSDLGALFVARLNATLTECQWIQPYGSNITRQPVFTEVLDDGSVIVTGSYTIRFDLGDGNVLNGEGENAFVLKIDAAGNVVWAKSIGDDKDFRPAGLVVHPSGEIDVAGNSDGIVQLANDMVLSNSGMSDGFVVRMDSDGQILGGFHIGDDKDDRVLRLILTKSNGVLLAIRTDGMILAGQPLAEGQYLLQLK